MQIGFGFSLSLRPKMISGGLPLDGSNTLPIAAFSETSRLRTAYTGPLIRILDTVAIAEQDIGYTASNLVDLAAIATFAGSNPIQITRIYEQMGTAGYNYLQPTVAFQPLAGTGNAPSLYNGRLVSNFQDGVGNRIMNSTSPYWDQVAATIIGFQVPPTTGYDPAGRNGWINNRFNGGSVLDIRPIYRTWTYSVGATDYIGPDNSVAGGVGNTFVFTRDVGGVGVVHINGVQVAAAASGTYQASGKTDGPTLGGQQGTRNWRGQSGAHMYFGSALSAADRNFYERYIAGLYGTP